MMMRGEDEFAIRVPAVVTEDFSPQIPREVILRLASQHLLIWKLIWNSTSCSRIPVYFKVTLLTERMVRVLRIANSRSDVVPAMFSILQSIIVTVNV